MSETGKDEKKWIDYPVGGDTGDGKTCLHFAAELYAGDHENIGRIFQAFQAAGADMNPKTNEGKTPVDMFLDQRPDPGGHLERKLATFDAFTSHHL